MCMLCNYKIFLTDEFTTRFRCLCKMRLSVLSVLCLFASLTNSYKILFLAPFNCKSHWIFLESIVKGLLERDHEVTCITSISMSGSKPDRYTEILVDPPLDFNTLFTQEELFKLADFSPISTTLILPGVRKMMVDYALSSENVRKFIHRDDLQFDLVINEEFFQEAFAMFAHKYKTPLITISTYGNSDFFDHQMGLLTPWSHVPNTVLSYSDNMTFFERCYNTLVSTIDWLSHHFVHLPNQAALAKKHFSHLEPLPTIDYLLKNVSLIMVNTHRSVLPPRPTMPGIINIGGAHIKPPKKLPDDIQTFLDGAQHGAIYFSLGTILNSSEMPKDKFNIIVEAFKRLQQRIIWKFEDESIAGLPSNVMIRKWLPQSDILAHKNVILFIAHGGMFGNFEAIARGVPLLIFPFFADQHRNAIRVAKAGYGRYMSFVDITADSLYDAIQELITNKSYFDKAKEISTVFGDNLVHPLDEAMFWIEYVCRHRGAKHLKSHAMYMSWFTYLLLDVISATVLGASIIIVVVVLVWKAIKQKIFTNKSVANKKQN